jgi:multiple sugar transport system substrate-binding protein
LQDLIGSAINAALVGQADPKTAMDAAQAKAETLFK